MACSRSRSYYNIRVPSLAEAGQLLHYDFEGGILTPMKTGHPKRMAKVRWDGSGVHMSRHQKCELYVCMQGILAPKIGFRV